MPPWWLIVGSPILAAAFGAIFSGYLVTRWKTREDQIEKRFDELCQVVSDTAELASEYWQGTAQDPGMAVREARILASTRRIAGLRVLLIDHVSAAALTEIQAAESAFLREVSGGQFGVHNRVPDFQRIISTRSAGVELILTARRARLRDLRGMWRRA
jgi:hypothetical protein